MRRTRAAITPDESRPSGGAAAPAPIRTLLADDHTMVRQGLRALLGAERDIDVIGEAEDGRRAVDLARSLRPDVVVMDIAMPLLNGIEATKRILEAAPATRVVILSAHNDLEYVERITGIGAAAYVLKQSSLEDLATAIRTAKAGGTYLSPALVRRDAAPPRGQPSELAARRRAVKLTERETEVLQMVAEGRANKEVAAELGISIKTVEKHRQSLMTKLDIHDVAGLTRHAISIRAIDGRDPPPV